LPQEENTPEEINYPELVALMRESQSASHELFMALVGITEAIIRENKMLRERLKQYEPGGIQND
jgi:hypothetical protein